MTLFDSPILPPTAADPPNGTATDVVLVAERVNARSWRLREALAEVPLVQLEVIRLDRTNWRISDMSIDERDSNRLLGYIERVERSRYEAMWLAAPIGWAYVASFVLALAAIGDRDHFGGTVELKRDPSVPMGKISPFHRTRRRSASAPSTQPLV